MILHQLAHVLNPCLRLTAKISHAFAIVVRGSDPVRAASEIVGKALALRDKKTKRAPFRRGLISPVKRIQKIKCAASRGLDDTVRRDGDGGRHLL